MSKTKLAKTLLLFFDQYVVKERNKDALRDIDFDHTVEEG